MELTAVADYLLRSSDAVWTFLLLSTRYMTFFMSMPGIGDGTKGLAVRGSAIFMFSILSLQSSPHAKMPADWAMMTVAIVSEGALGFIVGLLPRLIVSGAQMAGQLASTSMGLGSAQLFDPTTGGSVSDIAKIYGDLVVVLFLLLGGHHVLIHALSGLNSTLVPGTFVVSDQNINSIIDISSAVFESGVLISAPVIVALLLTQFVMGILSKAVPTVNVFIVSFPITIGIGLGLTILGLWDFAALIKPEVLSIERLVNELITQNPPTP
jgi:flagellar biosynthetic protein FliR